MTRWMVLLEKKSLDGSTNARWCIAGVRKGDRSEATCILRGDRFGPTQDGGPAAFVAQCLVLWDCNDDVTLSAQTRYVIEKWANGDFVIGGAT